jgi:hypothetical protein
MFLTMISPVKPFYPPMPCFKIAAPEGNERPPLGFKSSLLLVRPIYVLPASRHFGI